MTESTPETHDSPIATQIRNELVCDPDTQKQVDALLKQVIAFDHFLTARAEALFPEHSGIVLDLCMGFVAREFTGEISSLAHRRATEEREEQQNRPAQG